MSQTDHNLVWSRPGTVGCMACSLDDAIEEAKIREAEGWTCVIYDKVGLKVSWKKQGGGECKSQNPSQS